MEDTWREKRSVCARTLLEVLVGVGNLAKYLRNRKRPSRKPTNQSPHRCGPHLSLTYELSLPLSLPPFFLSTFEILLSSLNPSIWFCLFSGYFMQLMSFIYLFFSGWWGTLWAALKVVVPPQHRDCTLYLTYEIGVGFFYYYIKFIRLKWQIKNNG